MPKSIAFQHYCQRWFFLFNSRSRSSFRVLKPKMAKLLSMKAIIELYILWIQQGKKLFRNYPQEIIFLFNHNIVIIFYQLLELIQTVAIQLSKDYYIIIGEDCKGCHLQGGEKPTYYKYIKQIMENPLFLLSDRIFNVNVRAIFRGYGSVIQLVF